MAAFALAAQHEPRGLAPSLHPAVSPALPRPTGPSPPAPGLAPAPRRRPSLLKALALPAQAMVAQPLLLRTAMASSVLATASRLGAQALKQVRDARGLHRACRRQGRMPSRPWGPQAPPGSAAAPAGAPPGGLAGPPVPPSHQRHALQPPPPAHSRRRGSPRCGWWTTSRGSWWMTSLRSRSRSRRASASSTCEATPPPPACARRWP